MKQSLAPGYYVHVIFFKNCPYHEQTFTLGMSDFLLTSYQIILKGKHLQSKSAVPGARQYPTLLNPYQVIICLAVTCLVPCVTLEKHGSLEEMLQLVLVSSPRHPMLCDVHKRKLLMHHFFNVTPPPQLVFHIYTMMQDFKKSFCILFQIFISAQQGFVFVPRARFC